MNIKILAGLLFFVSIVVLSGCVGEPKCPSCSEAGSWSACSGEAVKTRTNYKCGEDTNFECQSFEETKNCATQILAKGKSVTMTISPSIEKEVKGIITLEVTNVPNDVDVVAFGIQGKGMPSLEETGPNLGRDTQASDGWNYLFDTTTYENGIYDLVSIAQKKGQSAPVDVAQAQIVIKN